ncbi:N-acetylmuramoyl-L-alanine amidase-like domain-containing protein [Saccharicrinis sp. FJH62]|uniref:N-acetylmuramoyl-L-alanine amidase-like domain-containing protein n=1 Tax=Saccharicrinis sp. FJH62 TaxID=3344657 RepID=UPI0035D4A30D
MLKWIINSLLAFSFIACQAQEQSVYYAGSSEKMLDSVLAEHNFNSPKQVAFTFINYPYKSHSLEIPGRERLVVDLTGFDCVTLVENSIALYLSGGSENDYLSNLRNLRYREGIINGYLSRLHYFTDWIINAEKSGIVKDVTGELGGKPYAPPVYFMSAHTDLYPRLERPTQIDSLKLIEERIGKANVRFIPKSSLTSEGVGIKDGDIVAIATNIKGLDFTHVGFALRKNDILYFLHASSQFHKVMVSDVPLSEYLDAHTHMLGIVVLRMKQ